MSACARGRQLKSGLGQDNYIPQRGPFDWLRAVQRDAIVGHIVKVRSPSRSPTPSPPVTLSGSEDDHVRVSPSGSDDDRVPVSPPGSVDDCVPLLMDTLKRLRQGFGNVGAGEVVKRATVSLAIPIPPKECASRTEAADVPLERWEQAFAMIDGGVSVLKASKHWNLGYSTLRRRYQVRDDGMRTKGPAPAMGIDGEMYLERFLVLRQQIGNCVTMEEFRLIARRIAARLGVVGFVAGESWEAGFWLRHRHLSRRTAENTERARGYAVSEFSVTKFFDVLEECGERQGKQWWCLDEWGIDLMNNCATQASSLCVCL